MGHKKLQTHTRTPYAFHPYSQYLDKQQNGFVTTPTTPLSAHNWKSKLAVPLYMYNPDGVLCMFWNMLNVYTRCDIKIGVIIFTHSHTRTLGACRPFHLNRCDDTGHSVCGNGKRLLSFSTTTKLYLAQIWKWHNEKWSGLDLCVCECVFTMWATIEARKPCQMNSVCTVKLTVEYCRF